MMLTIKIQLLLTVLFLLAGCAGGGTKPDPAYAPATIILPEVQAGTTGSLYRTAQGLRLFDDLRAAQVGDILTIILVENTDASKSASTSTSKANDYQLANPVVLGVPVDIGGSRAQNLGMNLNSSQEFSGTGSSTQSNRLQGSISVIVSGVMPNGNLTIQGEKIIGLNQGDEYVRVSGIVRPADIRPDNSVLSTQIANAHIKYGGKGAVASASIVGWLSRFFLAFAPF